MSVIMRLVQGALLANVLELSEQRIVRAANFEQTWSYGPLNTADDMLIMASDGKAQLSDAQLSLNGPKSPHYSIPLDSIPSDNNPFGETVQHFADLNGIDLYETTVDEFLSLLELKMMHYDSDTFQEDWQPSTEGNKGEEQRPSAASTEEQRLIQIDENTKVFMTQADIHRLLYHDIQFMDITEHPRSERVMSTGSIKYPTELTQGETFKVLSPHISAQRLEERLGNFSSFHTRFCKSELGLNSSLWLGALIAHEGAQSSANFSLSTVDHEFLQKSLIARFEGTHNPEHIVVIGAHLDSINLKDYYNGRAPGADDNGSGSITILEVLHLLAESGWEPRNTVEFHWYAAEEIGLLGSQDIFAKYAADGVQVKAMIQQDMTGGTTRDRGVPDDLGLVVDFVDPALTDFLRTVIDEYADIPYKEFRCGYACSDHASANRYGYPSSFIVEYGSPAAIPDPGPRVGHNELDTVDRIDFNHMVQHVKLSLGAVLELAEAQF